MSIDITINFIIRLLLAFIFLRAAMHKMRNYQHFVTQLDSYRLLPEPLLPGFAIVLIMTEVSLVFTLLVQDWLHPSLLAAAVLAAYAVAMGINLVRGREYLDCGCSGPSGFQQTISWALVIRNSVLAMFALATALPITARTLSVQDVGTVFLASVAAMLIYASIEQALTNQQRQRHHFESRAAKVGPGTLP